MLSILIIFVSQCIVMASSSSILGKWEISSCNDTHGFICQRKVGEKRHSPLLSLSSSFSLLLFILFFLLLFVSILGPVICNVTKCCPALLDSGIPVPTPTMLPRGWVKLANDSYKVLPQNRTWPEARMQCEAEEGQLASTLDELSAAYLELQALKLQTPLWIGLNRNEVQY